MAYQPPTPIQGPDFMQQSVTAPIEKVCRKCGIAKPLTDYRKYRNACKPCHVESVRNWRSRNPERRRLYYKPVYSHSFNLRKKYGMTVAQFDVMLDEQNHRCKICGKGIHIGKKRLHVDHTETDGVRRVRGLLCPECNKGLGLFYDKPQLLRQAANYLEATGA